MRKQGESYLIKSYTCLNDKDKKAVLQFICRNEEKVKTIDTIENECTNEVHGYGKGSLFMFDKDKVIARANIVLEVVKVMKTVYIHYIDILESAYNKEEILSVLLGSCVKLANEYEAEKVLLGIRNDELLAIANNIGLESTYSAFNMILEKREVEEKVLELIPLDIVNMQEYVDIYNKSFMDMPHGTYTDEEEAVENFKKADKNNLYFIVSNGKINIGFLEITINDNTGCFDIGLCKEFRGMGYGKRLLETAIDYLNKVEVKQIELIVIEKNKLAFDMYKNRGFKVYNNLSKWIELR